MRVPKEYRNPFTGQTWKIRFAPNVKASDGDPAYGICDYTNREIVLDARLHGRELLEILLEEAWHSKGARNKGHRVNRRLETVLRDIVDILIALGLVKL